MAHLNYYVDLCVDVYVVHDGAVLLRLHEKYNDWCSPGGHIEPGEDVNEAALREVWEEVGLKVELIGPSGWVQSDSEHNKELVPPVFVNRHRVTDTHDHSNFVFVARASSREISPQVDEDIASSAKCVWVTEAELNELKKNDKRLSDDRYRYAMTALRLVNFS